MQHLDGLRGLAIISVALYHAYSRWTDVVPYHADYRDAFRYGWLGVELFFLISGYVILMTLDRCRSFGEFITRRWLRLFPAMLICTVLICLTAPLFPYRPYGMPTPDELLPGLTFIDARWWSLLGGPETGIEGSFWSLYVEMKFYFIFGSTYFLWGRRAALATILVLFVLYQLLHAHGTHEQFMAIYLLDAEFFVWFAAGALFYEHQRLGDARWLALALLVGICAAMIPVPDEDYARAPALAVVALFGAAMVFPMVQRILSNRVLLFFGFISYPLYLLHENAMISLVIQIRQWVPEEPMVLLPILPLLLLSAVAAFVAARAEPAMTRVLKQAFLRPRLSS